MKERRRERCRAHSRHFILHGRAITIGSEPVRRRNPVSGTDADWHLTPAPLHPSGELYLSLEGFFRLSPHINNALPNRIQVAVIPKVRA